VDIQEVLADPSGVVAQPVTTVQPHMKLRTLLPWVAAAIVLAAIITGVAVWRLKPSEPRQIVRFYYELQKDQEFSNAIERNLAVSPDGRHLVFGAKGGLYQRSLDELGAKLIPGTEGNPEQPFYSPDGKWIGYWSKADNKIKKVAIGSLPVALCDAQSFQGELVRMTGLYMAMANVASCGFRQRWTRELLAKGGACRRFCRMENRCCWRAG
jgi:hypothetical protein